MPLSASSIAAAAPFIVVVGALALVGVAVWQVVETAQLIRDNWDKFVFAFKTGRLNDIPVFGFFFNAAQRILGGIENARRIAEFAGSLIPQFAEGGIVTRPTLAVIGEAGPEAVIPLHRSRGLVTGRTIEINVDVPDSRLDSHDKVQQLAEIVGDAFAEALRRAA